MPSPTRPPKPSTSCRPENGFFRVGWRHPNEVKIRNPKHEIRNKFKGKKNGKFKSRIRWVFWTSSFALTFVADGGVWLALFLLFLFGFVSDFVLRISDFPPPHVVLLHRCRPPRRGFACRRGRPAA